MADLNRAAIDGGRLEILIALRARLISGLEDASSGVIPQYAKQIADLTREIDELQPADANGTDVDDFAEDFHAEISEPKAKPRARKK